MDSFEFAAQRLERDQSKLRGRHGRTQHISAKAKREADYRKRQQLLMKEQRDREQAQQNHVQKVFTKNERSMGVKDLGKQGTSLSLMATSIHGDGDKIALPPSVLERLTSQMDDEGASSPWTFRVGILNPDYTFPASLAMKNLKLPVEGEDDDDDDAMDEDDKEQSEYLEELSHKYIAYSHATVVEFTQEEDHIGLPAAIAAALLDSKRRRDGALAVETMRTQDPAAVKSVDDGEHTDMQQEEEEKTPGHLAWGAFDVPNVPLEISLVKLPKGRGCTLVPSMEAIRSGFHQLKDVKLVLEQSLIRTRATLSIGDTVATWHRGVKYDLTVASVTPADWRAVSCINTDIEVDIGPNEEAERLAEEAANAKFTSNASSSNDGGGQTLGGQTLGGQTLGGAGQSASSVSNPGQTLGGSTSSSSESTAVAASIVETADLIPEPPTDQSEGVCTVQIRADKGAGRRRFDVNVATVGDLFAFASSLTGQESFQLVTRFPRRVVTLIEGAVLSEAGIQAGQELFMVEAV